MNEHSIAICGATGNVGREILTLISQRKIKFNKIYALASARSIGKQVSFGSRVLTVECVDDFDFTKVEIVCLAAGSSFAKEYHQKILDAGCIIIDNSAAFRMEDGVPLIVAGVNMKQIKNYKDKRIVSNSNCITAPFVLALKALEKYDLKRAVVSTYQSVSGAGKLAMDELYNRTKAFYEIAISGKEVTQRGKNDIFQKDIAFNCIPQIDIFLEEGKTKEEWKIEVETKKILNNQNIQIAATCVRVPVFVGHSLSISIEFNKPFSLDEVYEALNNAEGIIVLDRRENGGYVSPRDVVRTTDVYVSRIRKDSSVENGLLLWISSDNVYGIGAAYNTVRILEELMLIMKSDE